MIDKDEYPQTAELEIPLRKTSSPILAPPRKAMGRDRLLPPTWSSEACMLGVALVGGARERRRSVKRHRPTRTS